MNSPLQAPQPRNPTPLSANQEAGVQETYHRRVREHCAKEIKAFAECATGRTLTATWKCRDQRLTMNGCMISHATQEEHDAARQEWFSKRDERRAEREAEAHRVAEAKKSQDAWWEDYRKQQQQREVRK